MFGRPTLFECCHQAIPAPKTDPGFLCNLAGSRLLCNYALVCQRSPGAIRGPSAPVSDPHAVLDLGVAGCLKLLERLPAHGGVNMQIGHANDCRQLLQYEEGHAIVNEPAPVESAHQIGLL